MKVAVWYTGHTIADTVAQAIPREGVSRFLHTSELCDEIIAAYDLHICYGILRGAADVFRACDRIGKNWVNLDKGYFKPEHYSGFYRVSLRGTQQTSGLPEPDWERWKNLHMDLVNSAKWEAEMLGIKQGYTLVCPPTDYVADWLGLDWKAWHWQHRPMDNFKTRLKGEVGEIDWENIGNVITFNSSVGWEALRRGIPVESDPVHSIVGAWQAKNGTDKREELFATMAGLQLTLDEMRGGLLLPLLQKLLDADKATKA